MSISVEFQRAGLTRMVPGASEATPRSDDAISFAAPIQMKRRGVEAKLVMRADGSARSAPDQSLIDELADAYRWLDDLRQRGAAPLRDLAKRYGRDIGEISRTLPLAFLAPGIVEAIAAGTQPVDMTARSLKRFVDLPRHWDQ